jgi:hypothetical protein
MKPAETIPGTGVWGRINENYVWYIVRTFVNASMCPHSNKISK